MSAIQKGSIGEYQIWLAGKMIWQVRKNGVVVETARNCSDCWRAAERLKALDAM